jgi:hypothetical protein
VDIAATFLGPAVVAAVVSVVLTAAVKTWIDSRTRRRERFASAYSVYRSYCEFPYVIRRRRADQPEAERLRISEALRAVQEQVEFHRAWTQIEDAQVGAAYERLVGEMRRAAGIAMRDAWVAPACTADADMNIAPDAVDLSSLRPHELAYIEAVTEYFRIVPRWARSAGAR